MKKVESRIKRFAQLFCLFSIVFMFFLVYEVAADVSPPGSYKKTCKKIQYNASDDRITSAYCQKIDGSWKYTYVNNAKQCVDNKGDISNCDGSLDCTGINLPVSSYTATCFCCKMTGTTLSCYCKDAKFRKLSNRAWVIVSAVQE